MLDSKTRGLTSAFAEHWKATGVKPEITYRELGNTGVSHVSGAWIAATLKPATNRSDAENKLLAESNAYIAELKEADIIVLGTPMYNWSVPSTLKAYIDQVMRVNETFRVDAGNAESSYVGLLQNKTLLLLLSRGGEDYEEGQANAHMNFQSTYLKTVFNVMGVQNIHAIAIDGASLDKENLKYTIEEAHRKVRDLITEELN